jgi:RNA polymerase sigma factor (sigma-70 family)
MSTHCPSRTGACALPERAALQDPRHPQRELIALVRGARAGNNVAWTQLFERFDPTLRQIARSYRLQTTDIDDVIQATWLDTLQNIERLREPAAIAGWLATTTRRKAMRLLQVRVREHLTDEPELSEGPDPDGPETRVLASERHVVLTRAVATLPDRHRRLMILLLTQPDLDYKQISNQLAIPVGSIGPIRARSLARLQRHPELRTLHSTAA